MTQPRERFECPDCGVGVMADEDGCCATCGRDTFIVVLSEAEREAAMLALVEALDEWLEEYPFMATSDAAAKRDALIAARERWREVEGK